MGEELVAVAMAVAAWWRIAERGWPVVSLRSPSRAAPTRGRTISSDRDHPRMFGGAIARGLQVLGPGGKAGGIYGEVAADDQTNQVWTPSQVLHGDPNKTGLTGSLTGGLCERKGRRRCVGLK